jgi:uncharacterized protein (DUF697 family)/predicted GTPase
MVTRLSKMWSGPSEAELDQRLQQISSQTPTPVIWLLGKTQSGKTSIIKYLTGAADAEIGQGFKPCTRFSRQYDFPPGEVSLVTFLDTRGLEEPGYDAVEDMKQFSSKANVILVTIRLLDQAVGKLIEQLRALREAHPHRPVVLVITSLHEAYPQQQHPEDYPSIEQWKEVNQAVAVSLQSHLSQFAGLFDHVVPLDLTPVAEGFEQPEFGGHLLKEVLLAVLPAAYRQSLLMLDRANNPLEDYFVKKASPHIMAYSLAAATAGAFPIPWLDLFVLPAIQTRMIHQLARVYGQPLDGKRFLEFASTLGLGMMVRQAIREVVKFIPFVGSATAAVLAGTSTFALGKAFCYYYRAVHQGHVPRADELKKYYKEQMQSAEKLWKKK